MDPYSLFKVVWRHWKLAAPVVLITLLGASYVLLLGPRSYESTAVFVIANPDVPSETDIDRSPRLARLNSDNPYLRADDSSLIVKALVSKMSSQSLAQSLKDRGLSTDYTVAQSAMSTMTVMVSVFGDTPPEADATRQAITEDMARQLHDLQKINGADDRYLFSALPIDSSDVPQEKVSSRLRSLILVLAAGGVLGLGVLSLGVAADRRRASRTGTASLASEVRPATAEAPLPPSPAAPAPASVVPDLVAATPRPAARLVDRSRAAAPPIRRSPPREPSSPVEPDQDREPAGGWHW